MMVVVVGSVSAMEGMSGRGFGARRNVCARGLESGIVSGVAVRRRGCGYGHGVAESPWMGLVGMGILIRCDAALNDGDDFFEGHQVMMIRCG